MLLSFPLGQVSILLYKAVVSVHYQVMLNCSVGGAVLSLHKIMQLCLFKTVGTSCCGGPIGFPFSMRPLIGLEGGRAALHQCCV